MNIKSVILTLVILFGLNHFILADNYTDSLIHLSKTLPNKIERVEVLSELTEKCPIDEIHLYANQLIKLSEEILTTEQDPKKIAEVKSFKANALNNLGFMFKRQGLIAKALDNFYLSIELSESIDDSIGMADTYTNLGSTYEQQDDLESAEKYFLKGLVIYQNLNDSEGLGIIYNNLGQFYETKGDLNESIEYYQKSEKIWDNLNALHYKGYALNNIGINLDHLGLVDSALANFFEALAIFINENSNEDIAWTYNCIGRTYLEEKNYILAEDYLLKGAEICENLNLFVTRKEISQNLFHLFQRKKDYKQALKYYKQYISITDSIKNESTQKAAAKQQAKYEYEKQKVLDDAAHEKQIAIEQEAKKKQQILTYATAGGLGLVGIFLVVVFNRLKVTRQQKLVIQDQKQEVEQQKAVVEEAHSELEEKNKEITDSIQYAKRIQSAILPPDKLVKEYLQDSFVLYKPKDIVAGDFYWMESVGNKVLFAAADCTGHGVPGAMVSVVCNNGLNRSVREHGLTDPGEILGKTREIVVQEFEKSEEEVKDGMDIALCSLEGNKLEYAGAHNPLWLIRNGELLEIKANKQPIGKFDNPEPYTTHNIELQKGDNVYIFSDGYADQFGGEKGKKLKTTNFKKILLSLQEQSMESQRTSIEIAFEDWKGNLEQLDDVCVIGFKV